MRKEIRKEKNEKQKIYKTLLRILGICGADETIDAHFIDSFNSVALQQSCGLKSESITDAFQVLKRFRPLLLLIQTFSYCVSCK